MNARNIDTRNYVDQLRAVHNRDIHHRKITALVIGVLAALVVVGAVYCSVTGGLALNPNIYGPGIVLGVVSAALLAGSIANVVKARRPFVNPSQQAFIEVLTRQVEPIAIGQIEDHDYQALLRIQDNVPLRAILLTDPRRLTHIDLLKNDEIIRELTQQDPQLGVARVSDACYTTLMGIQDNVPLRAILLTDPRRLTHIDLLKNDEIIRELTQQDPQLGVAQVSDACYTTLMGIQDNVPLRAILLTDPRRLTHIDLLKNDEIIRELTQQDPQLNVHQLSDACYTTLMGIQDNVPLRAILLTDPRRLTHIDLLKNDEIIHELTQQAPQLGVAQVSDAQFRDLYQNRPQVRRLLVTNPRILDQLDLITTPAEIVEVLGGLRGQVVDENRLDALLANLANNPLDFAIIRELAHHHHYVGGAAIRGVPQILQSLPYLYALMTPAQRATFQARIDQDNRGDVLPLTQNILTALESGPISQDQTNELVGSLVGSLDQQMITGIITFYQFDDLTDGQRKVLRAVVAQSQNLTDGAVQAITSSDFAIRLLLTGEQGSRPFMNHLIRCIGRSPELVRHYLLIPDQYKDQVLQEALNDQSSRPFKVGVRGSLSQRWLDAFAPYAEPQDLDDWIAVVNPRSIDAINGFPDVLKHAALRHWLATQELSLLNQFPLNQIPVNDLLRINGVKEQVLAQDVSQNSFFLHLYLAVCVSDPLDIPLSTGQAIIDQFKKMTPEDQAATLRLFKHDCIFLRRLLTEGQAQLVKSFKNAELMQAMAAHPAAVAELFFRNPKWYPDQNEYGCMKVLFDLISDSCAQVVGLWLNQWKIKTVVGNDSISGLVNEMKKLGGVPTVIKKALGSHLEYSKIQPLLT